MANVVDVILEGIGIDGIFKFCQFRLPIIRLFHGHIMFDQIRVVKCQNEVLELVLANKYGHFLNMPDYENLPTLSPGIIFSDSANRDDTGKLVLGGVFHAMRASGFPFTSPPCFATAFITGLSGRIRDLPVTLNIVDGSGSILSSTIGRINAITEISLRHVAEISFPVPPTEFKVAGHYRAVVLIDGEPVGSRGLNVTL